MTASSDDGGGKPAADKDNQPDGRVSAETPALAIIEAFGGIRPMAKQLGLAVSTVQGWKERHAIPANRHDQIREAARKNNIEIDPAQLRAAAPADAAPSQPPVIEGKATAVAGGAAADTAKAQSGKAQSGQAQNDKAAEDKSEKTGEAPRSSAASAAARAGEPRGGREAAKSAEAPRRGGGGFMPSLVLGVVLAVAVAGATVYTQPYWGPLVSGDSQNHVVSTALADLEARVAEMQNNLPPDTSQAVDALNERLATAEAALSQGASQDPDTRAALESLNGQMARMTDRIEALEQELEDVRSVAGTPSDEIAGRLSNEVKRLDEMLAAQSELADRLAEAEARLGATQASRDAAPGSRETLLLLATLQLRDALRGSGPYEQPLTMLKNLAGEDSELASIIAPLERRASVGLPRLRELQASFPEAAQRVATIEFGEEGEGWTAGVLRRLSEAVNLRRVGLVEGDAPTAVVARAEVKLNEGDLAGALAELDSLEGAAAEAMANWRSEAEARLAGDRAISALGAQVSERFSAMADG